MGGQSHGSCRYLVDLANRFETFLVDMEGIGPPKTISQALGLSRHNDAPTAAKSRTPISQVVSSRMHSVTKICV